MQLYSSLLFTLLWAISLICTGISPTSWQGELALLYPSLLLITAGLILLGAHRNILALRVASILCVITWFCDLPTVPNHRWAHLCVALSVLIGGRRSKTIPEVFSEIQGTLRWLIVIVYFFAALAKMNWSYFVPAISCSGVFGSQTLGLFGIEIELPDQIAQLIALWSLIMEIALPILLIVPSTRRVGVWLGMLFHLSLSLHYIKYFANFSSAMFVLLASWLNEEGSARVYNGLKTRFSALNHVSIATVVLLVILSFIGLIGGTEYVIVRHLIFLAFALRLTFLTFCGGEQSRNLIRVGAPIGLVILLELVNGFAPYFGLKTRSALTMYSNLRIEPDYSNHFFMPPAFDPFGYFADSVVILQTADPGMQRRIDTESNQLPYISLCAYLDCQDDLCNPKARGTEIVYRRGPDLVTRTIGAALPEDCPPWIARKLIFLGPIGQGSERACTW